MFPAEQFPQPVNPTQTESPGADAVDAAIAQWGSGPTRLLQVLREVQERCNYLPAPALETVASRLGLPLSQVRLMGRL